MQTEVALADVVEVKVPIGARVHDAPELIVPAGHKTVGDTVGPKDGATDGTPVEAVEGIRDGVTEGDLVGLVVGNNVGLAVGLGDGAQAVEAKTPLTVVHAVQPLEPAEA